MRGIARAHGVSLATVQHHVGTKQELWEAAITHYAATLARTRRQQADGRLADTIRAALDVSGERPGLLAAILGDRSEGSEERLRFVAEQVAPMFDSAAARVEHEADRGRLRAFDRRALQILVFVGIGTIAGAPEAVFAMFGYDLSDRAERAQVADALADIIGFGVYEHGTA